MRGKVGRAGFLSRPAVPSRARVTDCESLPFGVGDEASVEHVGEPPLQAAQRFHAGLAGCDFAPEVGAAFGVVAQLDDRGHVQDVVHSPVPGPRQSVSNLFAR